PDAARSGEPRAAGIRKADRAFAEDAAGLQDDRKGERARISGTDSGGERNGERTGCAEFAHAGAAERRAVCAGGLFFVRADAYRIGIVWIREGCVHRSDAVESGTAGSGEWRHGFSG